MSLLNIILIISCAIFIVGIVYLIYLNVKTNMEKIDPLQCPKVRGVYGVTPGVTYINGNQIAVINRCGISGTSPCEFNVETVSEVIDYCNSLESVCSGILHSPNTKKAYIVDVTGTQTEDLGYNLYEPHL